MLNLEIAHLAEHQFLKRPQEPQNMPLDSTPLPRRPDRPPHPWRKAIEVHIGAPISDHQWQIARVEIMKRLNADAKAGFFDDALGLR